MDEVLRQMWADYDEKKMSLEKLYGKYEQFSNGGIKWVINAIKEHGLEKVFAVILPLLKIGLLPRGMEKQSLHIVRDYLGGMSEEDARMMVWALIVEKTNIDWATLTDALNTNSLGLITLLGLNVNPDMDFC
jgi:hypothetical protein